MGENGLRRFMDNIRPHFEERGKYRWLHSAYDAFDTFLSVPATRTESGSHIRDCLDLKRLMIAVVVALLPCFVTSCIHYGFLRILPLYLVTFTVGLGIEFAFAQIRGKEVSEGFLVTGMIIPMIVPVTIPLWMLALAVAFAVIIGKEAFGGTGMNIWNPALLARAFLFFGYPSHMTGNVWVPGGADAVSGATPLMLIGGGPDSMPYTLPDLFWGNIPGSAGEGSTFAILLGAIILLATGAANYRAMLSCVLGGLAAGFAANLAAPSPESALAIPAWYHLLMGGFAFGAVFMVTDPVTGAQTNAGKWIFGSLTGALTVVIRLFSPAYPEGMMIAILLMNTFVPLIDHCVVAFNINRRLARSRTV